MDALLEPDLPFTDQGKTQMGELYQVAAGADAAVLVDAGSDIEIDQGSEQLAKLGMYPRMRLHHAIEPGDHGGPAEHGRQQAAAAGAMATDEVVLELQKIFLFYLVLRHRTETGIDPVDELICREAG